MADRIRVQIEELRFRGRHITTTRARRIAELAGSKLESLIEPGGSVSSPSARQVKASSRLPRGASDEATAQAFAEALNQKLTRPDQS